MIISPTKHRLDNSEILNNILDLSYSMQQWGILGIGVLIVGLFTIGIGVQDVWAPDNDKPEKLVVKGNLKFSDNAFEIMVLVQLPKDAPDGYTVETSLNLFKPDGAPIRATLESKDTVPEEGVAEGGNNHSVHKIPIRIPYDPSENGLEGERVKAKITSTLFDPDGVEKDKKKQPVSITVKIPPKG